MMDFDIIKINELKKLSIFEYYEFIEHLKRAGNQQTSHKNKGHGG